MRTRSHVKRQADHRVPLIVIGCNKDRLTTQPCLRFVCAIRSAAERNNRNTAGHVGSVGEACMCKQRQSQNQQAEPAADMERGGSKCVHDSFFAGLPSGRLGAIISTAASEPHFATSTGNSPIFTQS